VIPNIEQLAERYLAGASLKQLSDETGHDRGVIGRRFERLGVQLRGLSDAERIKWSRMSPAHRSAQVKAAHDAVRGMRRTDAELATRAVTRYLRRQHVGHHVESLAAELAARGLHGRLEWPAGKYNLDLAIHRCRIAVEISCGGGNQHRRTRFAQRTQDVLDAGWSVLLVEAARMRRPFDVAAVGQQVPAGPRDQRLDWVVTERRATEIS